MATIALGQLSVILSESTHFNDVISAIINFFEVKSLLADPDPMRWTSLTDHENSLVNAIFWLQRAGATVELLTENTMRASFTNHIYTMHFIKQDFAPTINIEGMDHGADTLEEAVLTILTHQCKLLATKAENQ
jgi:aspartate/glutamate racemase